MLQQTQALRVAKFFPRFIEEFPTVDALARASDREVLRAWQGLGYNRRALALKKMAAAVVLRFHGCVPDDPEVLQSLPGIGRYTASAIAAFAFDVPTPMLETNIRTVLLHHFFPKKNTVSDKALLTVVGEVLDRKDPRRWYEALMDYGALLKAEKGNVSRRSAEYRKQPRFIGSNRQVRGAVIRTLTRIGRGTVSQIAKATGMREPLLTAALHGLERDGMVTIRGKTVILGT